jgi:sugar phosphate isomerase/epimerase
LKTPEAMRASLERVRDIGYRCVQISGLDRNHLAMMPDLCAELGLSATATHIHPDLLRYSFAETVEWHRRLGCADIGFGSAPDEARRSVRGWQAFAREMNEFGKRLSAHGMRLMYHNHSFEFSEVEGRKGMDILFEELDPSYVDFELDTYWIKVGGEGPEAWIRKVAGRMRVIHLKDYKVQPDGKPIWAEVGSGDLDWENITAAIADTGVKLAFVEQDTCPGDPLESIEASLDALRILGFDSWKV